MEELDGVETWLTLGERTTKKRHRIGNFHILMPFYSSCHYCIHDISLKFNDSGC